MDLLNLVPLQNHQKIPAVRAEMNPDRGGRKFIIPADLHGFGFGFG
jgi:hypothetical protein